jgi:CBS domain-containing protein
VTGPPRDYYATETATARLDHPVTRVAATMAQYAVGCVVVVDDARRPIGIVTDRDLSVRVVAAGRDPERTTVADVMSAPVALARADEPIDHVVERMRATGIRRLPVVRDGTLVGLVAVDDLVVHLGRELGDLGETVRSAIDAAREQARRERRREELDATFSELRRGIERAGRDAAEFVTREFESLRDRIRKQLE